MSLISIRGKVYRIIDRVINDLDLTKLPEFIEILSCHKSCFENFLQNEPRKSEDKRAVENAFKIPINVEGIPQKVTLTPEFINEALIISDLFNLNELTAVDMLLSGEAESTCKPEFPRALIVVINYYKSQLTCIDSLRLLLQAKYVVDASSLEGKELLNFIDNYLDDLFKLNLFNNIVELLKNMNIEREIQKLEVQRALGSNKHRRLFYELYNSIRASLAECLMLRVALHNASKEEFRGVILLVKSLYGEDDIIKKEKINNGITFEKYQIDNCFMNLLACVFFCTSPKLGSHHELLESEIDNLLFTDSDYQQFVSELLKDYTDHRLMSESKNNLDYQIPLINRFYKLVYLHWVVNLQKMSQIKQDQVVSISYQICSGYGDYNELADYEATNVDKNHVFECFKFMIDLIGSCNFQNNLIWMKCFHGLITDLIIYMPKLIKDLHKEESYYYAILLQLIGYLYGDRNAELGYQRMKNKDFVESLVLDFWSLHELKSGCDHNTQLIMEENSRSIASVAHESYRNSSLFKFIRDSGDYVEDQHIYISYVSMLKGMCCSERTALYIFCLLNNNNTRSQTSKLTWEWFSECLSCHADFWIRNPNFQQTMTREEVEGLMVVIQLMKLVIMHNRTVRCYLIRNESFRLPINLILLLTCRIPECLKAELINCLSSFCQQSEFIVSIWHQLASHRIISNSPNTAHCSIQLELDEVEPRLEQYAITRAFMSLLIISAPQIIRQSLSPNQADISQSGLIYANYPDMDILTNVVMILMDKVFLKHTMRSYRNPEERLIICEKFLQLCILCVKSFMDRVTSARGTKAQLTWCYLDPGYHIICKLITDSPFLRMILSIIDQGYDMLCDSVNKVSSCNSHQTQHLEILKNAVYRALDILWLMLSNEAKITPLMRELVSGQKSRIESCRGHILDSKPILVEELSKLMISIDCDYQVLIHLMRFLHLIDDCEAIVRKALSVFNYAIRSVNPHHNLLLILANEQKKQNLEPMSLLVTCLDKFGGWDEDLLQELEDNIGKKEWSCVEFSGIRAGHDDIRRLLLHFLIADPIQLLDSPRTVVLRMLVQCLESDSGSITPNLGQYFCGYNCQSRLTVQRTSLEEAGAGGGQFPKTCLHSLLSLAPRLQAEIFSSPCLNSEAKNVGTNEAMFSFSIHHIAELASAMLDLSIVYRILYLLASNNCTGLGFLRFVRNNYQFLYNQLDLLAFPASKFSHLPEIQTLLWSQKAVLLQLIAIELRVCSAHQQKAYVNKLLKLLFGNELFYLEEQITSTRAFDTMSLEQQGLIFDILEDLEVEEAEDVVDFSNSRNFKPEILKEYLSLCVEPSCLGVQLLNSDKLRQLIDTDINLNATSSNGVTSPSDWDATMPLHNHLAATTSSVGLGNVGGGVMSSSSGGNSATILYQQEVDEICALIQRYNRNAVCVHYGKMKVLEAWRELVEVVMLSETCTGTEMVEPIRKKRFIAELMNVVMNKVLSATIPPVLLSPLSRLCLMLSGILTGMFISEVNLSRLVLDNPEYLLDSIKLMNELEVRESETYLGVLVKMLMDCCVKINNKHHNTRIKFYGSLIFILQVIIRLNSNYADIFSGTVNDCFYTINNGISSNTLIEGRLTSARISDLQLYATLCRDGVSGNSHLVLSSLSVLDCLASIDKGDGQLIPFLVSQGYLRFFIDTLTKDCLDLSIFVRQSNDISTEGGNILESPSYYTFQTRMSLFSKLATYTAGAKALVQCGILRELTKCDLFKMRPVYDHYLASNTEPNSSNQLFSELISASVQLATNILSTLGTERLEAVKEVLLFVGEFAENLCSGFLNRANLQSTEILQELMHISDLFVLLIPAIMDKENLFETEQRLGVVDSVKHAVSQCLVNLLATISSSTESQNPNNASRLQIAAAAASGSPFSLDDSRRQYMMLHLRLQHAQLLSNMIAAMTGIVSSSGSSSSISSSSSSSSSQSQRFEFFSSSIEGINTHRTNFNQLIRKFSQSIAAGNKPPLTMLVLILLKLQELMEELDFKLSNFNSLSEIHNGCSPMAVPSTVANGDYSSGRRGSDDDSTTCSGNNVTTIERILDMLSVDQLRGLYNSTVNCSRDMKMAATSSFAAGERGRRGDGNAAMSLAASVDSSSSLLANVDRSELVLELVNIYRQLTHVFASLQNAGEGCCYLLWHHLMIFKNRCPVTESRRNEYDSVPLNTDVSFSSGSYHETSYHHHHHHHNHPLLRLQKSQAPPPPSSSSSLTLSSNCLKVQPRINDSKLISATKFDINNTNNATTNEILLALSKCLDDSCLSTLQKCLEKRSAGGLGAANVSDKDDSFAKVIIHRLVRLMKLI